MSILQVARKQMPYIIKQNVDKGNKLVPKNTTIKNQDIKPTNITEMVEAVKTDIATNYQDKYEFVKSEGSSIFIKDLNSGKLFKSDISNQESQKVEIAMLGTMAIGIICIAGLFFSGCSIKRYKIFEYASDNIKDNKKQAILACKESGWNLEHVSERLKDDKELVLISCKDERSAYIDASERLKKDVTVILAAYNSYWILSSEFKDDDYFFQHVPKEAFSNKSLIEQLCSIESKNIKYASDELKNDKDFILKLVQINSAILKHLSPQFKDNKEIILAAVKNSDTAIKYASQRLQDDIDVAMAALTNNKSPNLQYISKRLQKNNKLMLAAIKKNGANLQYASKELQANKEVVIAACNEDGYAIQYADDKLKSDEYVYLIALYENPNVIDHFDSDLAKDAKMILTLIEHSDFYLNWTYNRNLFDSKLLDLCEFAHRSFNNKRMDDFKVPARYYTDSSLKNKELLLIDVVRLEDTDHFFNDFNKHQSFLLNASDRLRDKKFFVLLSSMHNGGSLAYASKRLQDDKEVVLAACKEDGMSIQYASKRLQDDKEVVLAACKENGEALEYVAKRYQDDPVITLHAAQNGGLQYCSDEIKNNKSIVITAMLTDPTQSQFEYVSDELKQDPDIQYFKNLNFERIKLTSTFYSFFDGLNERNKANFFIKLIKENNETFGGHNGIGGKSGFRYRYKELINKSVLRNIFKRIDETTLLEITKEHLASVNGYAIFPAYVIFKKICGGRDSALSRLRRLHPFFYRPPEEIYFSHQYYRSEERLHTIEYDSNF